MRCPPRPVESRVFWVGDCINVVLCLRNHLPEIVFFGLVIASMWCYVCEIISPESRVFLGGDCLKSKSTPLRGLRIRCRPCIGVQTFQLSPGLFRQSGGKLGG